ncbi:acyl-CoA dehydrogenase [Homoserinimonas sp. OAct 916]|uniref:acyl-CoA dehydrogenase n=1 Tax=Homoserinimonas sp. OAct 916 TaxID=2211450 RepID=UPI000DBE24EC|nr:acyl-CoA dehydrogenase [Homoserinimonas sp. OAct 916]
MNARWTPTEEYREDAIAEAAAGNLHDLLDRPGTAPITGQPLPILWHWLAFTPRARQSEISPDGHPVTGRFLPPAAGRRRMYAGGTVSVSGNVAIGAPLQRRSLVTDVTEKSGRSGDLLFVTVEHEIASEGGSISDRNDIVYRDATGSARMAESTQVDTDWTWGRSVVIDPVVLFRMSALTYNAHRIHYDRDYARGVEGYPGLVVHGPLQALLLADLADRTYPDRQVASFTFRSTAPAFDENPLELRGRMDEETGMLDLAVFTRGGVQSMRASAVLATPCALP